MKFDTYKKNVIRKGMSEDDNKAIKKTARYIELY